MRGLPGPTKPIRARKRVKGPKRLILTRTEEKVQLRLKANHRQVDIAIALGISEGRVSQIVASSRFAGRLISLHWPESGSTGPTNSAWLLRAYPHRRLGYIRARTPENWASVALWPRQPMPRSPPIVRNQHLQPIAQHLLD